jgi:hypothetical protein
MSWNNVIPMKMVECMMICGNTVDAEGYTIHKPECPIGIELSKRDKSSDEKSKED